MLVLVVEGLREEGGRCLLVNGDKKEGEKRAKTKTIATSVFTSLMRLYFKQSLVNITLAPCHKEYSDTQLEAYSAGCSPTKNFIKIDT